MISPYELVNRLYKNHPELVQAMKESDHNYSYDHINVFHEEGDVWTHTMMVFNHAVTSGYPVDVQIAALLHDVAKPDCRDIRMKEDEPRVSFFGHCGFGFYRSIDVLRKSFSDILSENDIIRIATLVAIHQDLYEFKGEKSNKAEWAVKAFATGMNGTLLLEKLVQLAKCDNAGRIAEKITPSSHFDQFLNGTHVSRENKDAPTITLLVGPPNCGKSTWLEENHDGETIISRDGLVMYFANAWRNKLTYNEAWNVVDHKVVDNNLQKQFHTALKNSENIIVDMTNMSKKARRKWLNPARQKGYETHAVVFHTGYETIMNRNANREGKFIPVDVIHNMMKSFTFPNYEEFDHIYNVVGE